MDNQNQMPPADPQMGKMLSPLEGGVPRSSFGPVVGAVIIIIVLILGGWYFWRMNMGRNTAVPAPTQSVENSSPSDDLDSIDADLNASSVDHIDSGLNAAGNDIGS